MTEMEITESKKVDEFDLVCDREWLISFSKSVYMTGFMVSVFITGQLSDRMGRRIVIVGGYILGCISLTLSPFVNSMTVFLILRFLYALGETGSSAAGKVLVMEVVGKEYRTLAGILIHLSMPLGILSLTVVGYFIKNWFWFQIAILLPTLVLLLFYRMVPESPRYLMMHQKDKELQKLMEIAAKKNGLKPPDSDISKCIIDTFLKNNPKEISGNLLDVFKKARMRRRILNLMYCWLVNYFIYYGISYNTNCLAGNPYINFAIAGSLDIPGVCVSFYAAKYIGRKWSLAGLTLMCCIPTGILILLNGPEAASTGLYLFAFLCISSSSSILYLYTGELFPTIVRNSALGVCDTTARAASILSPFVKDLAEATSSSFLFMVNFFLALTSGVLVFCLPKTAGRKLPDTMEEGENLGTEKAEETSKPQNDSGFKNLLCCKC